MYVSSVSSYSIFAFNIRFDMVITFLLPVMLFIAFPICKCLAGFFLPDVALNTLSSEMYFILCVLGAVKDQHKDLQQDNLKI